MWERLKATGRAIKHRRLTFALLVAFLTIGVIGGLYAIQSGATFSGQTAAGDHNWWPDIGGNAFCENCHTGVADDISGAGAHDPPDAGETNTQSDCSYCHTPAAGDDTVDPAIVGDHAAAQAACTDCHAKQYNEVANATEAHNGILADLGEDQGVASQTCQSCHTHVEVNITATPQGPIQLIMGN